MPHRRQLSAYLEGEGYLNQPVKLRSGTYIHSSHINSARLALEADRESFYKNALIAYCSVFKLIASRNYSWAFVHSYYSVVYLYQVLLAFNDISLCYDQGKPFSIKLTSGARFKKENGNTHEAILSLFKKEYDTDAEICSDIEGKTACDWFEDMRNRINYRTMPQQDPTVGYGLFDFARSDELRKRLSLYFIDLEVYAYAAEHAYVAYPLLLIRRIMRLYKGKGHSFMYLKDNDFMKYLRDNIRDTSGPLTSVLDLINGVGI